MLKPIDIHNAEFKRSFKGYNEAEVDAFIAKVVIEYERVFNEHKSLQEEVKSLQAKLMGHSNREQDVYDMIALTKESLTEAKELANRQAKALITEAKDEARRIILQAEKDAEDAKQRIVEIKKKEESFKVRMRQVMETFWAMLEDDPKSPLITTEQKVVTEDELSRARYRESREYPERVEGEAKKRSGEKHPELAFDAPVVKEEGKRSKRGELPRDFEEQDTKVSYAVRDLRARFAEEGIGTSYDDTKTREYKEDPKV